MANYLLLLEGNERLHTCHLKQNEPAASRGDGGLAAIKLPIAASIEWNGEFCLVNGRQLGLNETVTVVEDDASLTLYLLDEEKWLAFDTAMLQHVTFGREAFNDVRLRSEADFAFVKEEDGSFRLEVYSGRVYHNYSRAGKGCVLEPGDRVYTEGVLLAVRRDKIEILESPSFIGTGLAPIYEQEQRFTGDYPDYHRSPRIIYREPDKKKVIAKPSSKPSKPSEQLARTIVPPLVMIAACVFVSFFSGSRIYLVMMLSMTIVTIIFSITSYIKSWKQYRIDIKERDIAYRNYLKQKAQELHQAFEEQRHALKYHYPAAEELRRMAADVNSRIYEKTMFHHDFLMYRTGIGEADPSFPIEFSDEEFSMDKDELLAEARKLRSRFTKLEEVPVTASLLNGPVGYIGQRKLVIEQLQLLVMQTALFHSYYDVQFIAVFPEEEKSHWDWMRWLPHASVRDINVRGFVYHERSRDQVLNSLLQIIKERKMAFEERANKHEKIYFSPRFVVLITDEKMILDHSVMEFFNENPSELGVSLVFVQDVMQSLPEHVRTVIDIRDAASGTIILEDGDLVNRAFAPDHFPDSFEKEDLARSLAALNHLQSLKNSIPESVTFLEMYEAGRVEDLRVTERWARNETYKTLAVPLGMRGKEDLVQLNLHEKAHGPHGLVAGTTGSGKSEIIQSYILSLAVNFHPHETAFLLIDYKGGGMANLFKNLPHLLGAITNLDGAQSMRALASIKAELQRRQRLFGEHDVNHINQYQKLYKSGKVSEPMPHLFLISDEFAELKAEQPDFMKELVSTARIGRSLGIHLILATQKPSGVVDDQIWSNSKFKLALKVQNASDSMEVLKTPDAAEITLPGRAYLQVGNNEIYELFQSAWSGAPYGKTRNDEEAADMTVYAINDLGQYEAISEDLSGLSGKEEVTKSRTELEAVIDYIRQTVRERNIAELPRPWLPPLEERIYLTELHPVSRKAAWYGPKQPLTVTAGFVDLPERQAQEPLVINLAKDGHLAVISSPGYGKSTFLQTVVMDAARQHNPQRLHVYLMDMGTNGLLPLKELPHTADTFMADEEEKLAKLFRRLRNELKDRKRKLSQYGVANLEMFERASGEELPAILLVIDTADSVHEAPYRDEFEQVIGQIAREGGSAGIHMVISAGRQNAIRMQIMANIKHQISLYQIDESEPRSIVGRTDLKIEEMPGRGLVKLEQPAAFQTALPVRGEDTLELVENIQREGREMAAAWKGAVPAPVPMVPEILEFRDFIEKGKAKAIIARGGLPFAIDFEEAEPVELSVAEDQNTLVLSDSLQPVETAFVTLLQAAELNSQMDFRLIDNAHGRFWPFASQVSRFADRKETLDGFVEQLQQDFQLREAAFREVQKAHGTPLKEFLLQIKPVVVFVTDVMYVIEEMSAVNQEILAKLIETGSRMGIHFVLGAVHSAIDRKYDDLASITKKQKNGVLIGRMTDQTILEAMNRSYKEKSLQPFEAYYIKQGKSEKIKIAAPAQIREDVSSSVL